MDFLTENQLRILDKAGLLEPEQEEELNENVVTSYFDKITNWIKTKGTAVGAQYIYNMIATLIETLHQQDPQGVYLNRLILLLKQGGMTTAQETAQRLQKVVPQSIKGRSGNEQV